MLRESYPWKHLGAVSIVHNLRGVDNYGVANAELAYTETLVSAASLICMLPGTANRKRIAFFITDFVDAHFRVYPTTRQKFSAYACAFQFPPSVR